ncbi:MAG TPA: DUF5652 family protein [Candidatus Moranbacteria bacterium]|nr:DUF5652 family protein [Candidatus Moranbacteria bacterium]
MQQFILENPWVLVVVAIWTLPWKGAALWRSARRGHFGWFGVLLVFNTLGILDISYIFFFSKPKTPSQQPVETEQEVIERLSNGRRSKVLRKL